MNFLEPAAGPYRVAVVEYLRQQLTADIAVTAWTPTALIAVLLLLRGLPSLTRRRTVILVSLITILLVPVLVVTGRIMQLSGPAVAPARILERVADRAEREQSFMHRHRADVARVETYVTNPILFVLLLGAMARSIRLRSMPGVLLSLGLMITSWNLYLGPSRRRLPDPIGDQMLWIQHLEQDLERRGMDPERPVPLSGPS